MAIIANQVPTPENLSEGYQPRIVLKFNSQIQLPYSEGAESAFSLDNQSEWNTLTSRFPGLSLSPYFTNLGETTLQELISRSQQPTTQASIPNFSQYYVINCPIGIEPSQIVEVISAWPSVEVTYIESGPNPPPVNASDDPRNTNQGYLDAAPVGIDARWAWDRTNGNGLGFVDLEQGWTTNHEDLSTANISIISGVNQAYPGHGTAVLGEVVAVDNTLGCIGIAPQVSTRVVSQWRSATTYNTAEAILSAASVMDAGDVLLLEAQARYPTASGFVPVEVEPAVFDAISVATSTGIVVIEAAGNGSVDLDLFETTNGQNILNRNSSDFRDSGATIVGAASSDVPHRRLPFSNYGSRVDCYGWGENIDTTGDGWMGTGMSTYTTSFGGTSGASPIVTGAALLLQSWREGTNGTRYSPTNLRELMSRVNLNTQSANPNNDKIGVMPDLRRIIDDQSSSPSYPGDKKYLALIIILISAFVIYFLNNF